MLILYLINIAVFAGFLFLSWKKPGIALSLLLLTAGGMFLSGLIYFEGEKPDESLVIYLLPILLVPISICLVHWGTSSNGLETPWYRTATGIILTIFKYSLLFAVFILVFQFLSPILFILFLIATCQFAQAQKFGLIMDIISTIGTSMRQSLPLPMALTSAACGQNKKEADIFHAIAHWLIQGYPLSEAMKRGYPKCPSDILASIATAEKMDQVPKAIESLGADLSEKISDYKITKPVHAWYPFVVLTILFAMMTGLSIFIIPTFSAVVADISEGQAYLPAATQWLVNFSGWITARKGLNAILVHFIILCVILFVIYVRVRRRNPENPRLLSRLGDWVKWHIPVLGWFEKYFGHLHLVQSLRVGLIGGYPLHTILRNASGLDINQCCQNRIKKWLHQIEAGDDIAQSASACGLDKALAWAMDEKVNKGNAPQILESLEEIYRNTYNYRKNVLSATGWPLVVLALGLAVGWVVYAMFIGIFSLITVTLLYTIPQ